MNFYAKILPLRGIVPINRYIHVHKREVPLYLDKINDGVWRNSWKALLYSRLLWEASFGDALTCEREPDNASDRYSVAMMRKSIPDIRLDWDIAKDPIIYTYTAGTATHFIWACLKILYYKYFSLAVENNIISTAKISRFFNYAIYYMCNHSLMQCMGITTKYCIWIARRKRILL